MKLRLKGNPQNSLRLRILRAEMERLAAGDTLEEAMTFGPGADNTFTYAIASQASAKSIHAEYHGSAICIIVPHERVQIWAQEDQVGIYETIALGDGQSLELVLEKDFACLDGSDAENAGTFQNPNNTKTC